MPQGLTVSPGFMRGCLLPELLSQVLHALQPPDLVQQPLLVALLCLLQPLLGARNVLGWLGTSTAHLLRLGPLGSPAITSVMSAASSLVSSRPSLTLCTPHPPQITTHHPHVLASKHLHYHQAFLGLKTVLLISEQLPHAFPDVDKGLHTLILWLLEAEATRRLSPKMTQRLGSSSRQLVPGHHTCARHCVNV